jgi:hypothetical protein
MAATALVQTYRRGGQTAIPLLNIDLVLSRGNVLGFQ